MSQGFEIWNNYVRNSKKTKSDVKNNIQNFFVSFIASQKDRELEFLHLHVSIFPLTLTMFTRWHAKFSIFSTNVTVKPISESPMNLFVIIFVRHQSFHYTCYVCRVKIELFECFYILTKNIFDCFPLASLHSSF